jgi:hypothetical protein
MTTRSLSAHASSIHRCELWTVEALFHSEGLVASFATLMTREVLAPLASTVHWRALQAICATLLPLASAFCSVPVDLHESGTIEHPIFTSWDYRVTRGVCL